MQKYVIAISVYNLILLTFRRGYYEKRRCINAYAHCKSSRIRHDHDMT